MSRLKNTTTFTVASADAVLGWEIETEFDEVPLTKDALAKIVTIVGIQGLENFLDHAMAEEQTVEIIISNEYDVHHAIEFDPFTVPTPVDSKNDTEFVLFMSMLSACLSEFLYKAREEHGKATS